MTIMHDFLSFVGCSLFLYIVYCCWVEVKSPLRSIPGPFTARFTNLWRLFDVYNGRAELTQKYLHDLHGIAVRIGPNTVSLSDPSLIKTIYSTKGLYTKSSFYDVNNVRLGSTVFGQIRTLSNMFSTRSNEDHARMRRPIQTHYSMARLQLMESRLDISMVLFSKRLDELIPEKVLRVDDWLSYLSWDVASSLTFGEPAGFLKHGNDVDKMIQSANHSFAYFAIIGQMPWLDNLLDKNPLRRFGSPAFAPIVAYCQQKLLERVLNPSDSSFPDFLQHFLGAKESFPALVSDVQVVAYLLMNMIAGTHSTAIALRAVIYYVHKSDTVLKELRGELDTASLSWPVAYNDTRKLPYLNAVIKEALRIYPGVGLLIERVVPPGGLTLRTGQLIPEDVIVGMNPWVVHRDHTIFGPDADAYMPDRWLQKACEPIEDFIERISRMNASLITFGAGNRVCLGQELGMLEISKVVASLFLKYDFTWVRPSQEWQIHNYWFMNQSGMEMNVKLRKTKDLPT